MHSPLSLIPQSRSADAAFDRTINGNITDGSTSNSAMGSYVFPRNRLKRVMKDSSRTPLCLIACGSFSPITYLHLRMFEMAADYAKFNTEFEIMGGYLSPVSDAYKKAGLASAEHRYERAVIFFNIGLA